MFEYLVIGKIVNTHGIKGEVKVMPLTDYPERFEELEWVYLDTGSNKSFTNSKQKNVNTNENKNSNSVASDTSNNFKKIEIQSVKYFKNTVILKIKGIDTIESAEALKNFELKVDRNHAVKLPKDSFFICDLIGCEVFEETGNKLGKLNDVLKTGSNDVYIVKPTQGKEILIPALKTVVKDINVIDKKIIVKLPEGLLDDEVWCSYNISGIN